ncbi:hypothetical protein GCM10027064_16710 [Microbacterium petrolearium]|jgi:hypothetical protein
MSTAILTAAAAPSAPRTRLRLTVRGRRVLAALAAAPVVAGLAAAVLGGGAALASGEAGADASAFHLVTVTAGDSLWSIAQDVAPGHDPRDVVYELKRLNNLAGGLVSPGQQIAVPAGYAD